uniref:Uncharacterized protein n=1 Tax=Timema tahoe TaxID=61484 RepID=A0A7R9IBB0_9NEOP|nr:unnamed protein product [Timema tahoe]
MLSVEDHFKDYLIKVSKYRIKLRPCRNSNQNGTSCSPESIRAGESREIVFAINGQTPGPMIQVCQHDVVIIDVENRLPGQETAIHWHGMTQRGSPYMDGVPMVTQCPIHSNSRFQYTFKATNPGTHFYHAHAVTQHAGGVFGPLLVKQPLQDDPHADLYEFDLEEHVVILSSLVPSTLIVDLNLQENFTVSSILINGRGHQKANICYYILIMKPKSRFRSHAHFMVNPGYKYKFRVINAISSDCPVLFSIDSHQVTIVEKDGAPVQSQDITKLVILPGERYDLVLNADKEVAVYNMRVKGYHFCQHIHQEALLIYDGAESLKEEIPLAGGKLYSFYSSITKDSSTFHKSCKDFLACIPELKGKPTVEGKKELHLRFEIPNFMFYMAYDFTVVNDFDGRVNFRYVLEGVPYYPSYLIYKAHPTLNAGQAQQRGRRGRGKSVIHVFLWVTAHWTECSFRQLGDIPTKPSLESLAGYGLDRVSTEWVLMECGLKGNPIGIKSNSLRVPQFSNISFLYPSSPILSQAYDVTSETLCGTDNNGNPVCTVYTESGKEGNDSHTFHMHGYHFHVLGSGFFAQPIDVSEVQTMDSQKKLPRNLTNPPKMDTALVPNKGYLILRIYTDNPGYWLVESRQSNQVDEVGLQFILHVGEISNLPAVPKNFPRCGTFKGPDFLFT